MSEMAKKAREAMKDKAKRLASDRPLEKVESSDFVPPAMLNADVKTGMRPVSPRAYKKGGKVEGEHAKMNMGRKPRTAGGKSEMPLVDRYINRDQKKANEFRDGEKHVGGMKKGGRAHKLMGGPLQGAQNMMSQAQQTAGVPGGNTLYGMGRSGVLQKGSLSPARAVGLKKGGEAKGHPDEAADKALIKKMVKPSARTGKDMGGQAMGMDDGSRQARMPAADRSAANAAMSSMGNKGMDLADAQNSMGGMKKGGRAKRKDGGGVFSGPGYPGKVPGAVPGGRTAHAAGGKTGHGKGKTDINIMINPHHPGADAGGMGMPPAGPMGGPTKPPGMGGPAGGMPIPPGMMPPGMGGPPGGMPMAGGPPGMPPGMPPIPPGMMPKPRKSGGRTYSSFEDMDAGSGGAKARIEKTEIARKHSGIQKQNY
jgi:hypothetical protein